MKSLLVASFLSVLVATGSAVAAPVTKKAPAAGHIRTIRSLPGFPLEALKQTVSVKFYRSLLVSPVEGWIVVKGQLVHGKFAGARVTRSELGGVLDKSAVELARSFTISGFSGTDRQTPSMAMQFHLVVYKIADGTMVVGVPASDESGGNQINYRGSAFLAVEQGGKWTQIKGPELRRR